MKHKLSDNQTLHLEVNLTGNVPEILIIIPLYTGKLCTNTATVSMVGQSWTRMSVCSL